MAAAPTAAPFVPETLDLPTLESAASGCQGCELFADATQTVFGDGPTRAPLMMAQASASPQLTSGLSGFAGGGLPVAVFQPVVRTFLVSMPVSTAPPVPISFHVVAPMAVSLP